MQQIKKIKGKHTIYTLLKPIGQGTQREVSEAVGDNQLKYALKFQKNMHPDEIEFLQKMIEEQNSQKLIKIHEMFKKEGYTIIIQD